MTMEWKSDGTNEAVTRAMFASDIDAIFQNPGQLVLRHVPGPSPVPPRVDDVQSSSVPPIAVRPPGKTGPGQRRDDDLTHKLNDIVKHNKVLKSNSPVSRRRTSSNNSSSFSSSTSSSTSTTPRLV
jgi:hypothetical protein